MTWRATSGSPCTTEDVPAALAFCLAAPQPPASAARSATAVRRVLCAAAAVSAAAAQDLSQSDDLELSESESERGIGISDPFSEEGASNTPGNGVSDKSNSAEVVSKTSIEKTDEVRRSYKAEARAKAGRWCNLKPVLKAPGCSA